MPTSRCTLALLLLLVPAALVSQESGRHLDDAGVPPYVGSFVRVGGGITTPLFASGSMRNWSRGWMAAVAWESTGAARERNRVAIGLAADVGRFPLDQGTFIAAYQTDTTGGRATTASAPDATLFDVQGTVRINIPSPVVTPSVLIALGYYNFRPSAITFQTPDSTGTARFRSRSGASLSIGLGVDRTLMGPAGLFLEGSYLLGASRFGFVAANGRCGYGACDIYRNTYIATIRSGLRIRIGS